MQSEYTAPETYAHLYGAMQYPNVLAMRIACETGIRIDDVLRLKSDQLTQNKIYFTASKTGKAGVKTISKALAGALEAYANGEGYIFKGRKAGKHRTRQAVYKDIKRACRLLGVDGQVSPHSARKTYAVELRKSKGLSAVQRELQHSRLDTTMLYAFSDLLTAKPTSSFDLDAFADLVADKLVKKIYPSTK